MLAALVQADHQIAIAPLLEPHPPPGGARVRLHGCGVCGSDLEKLIHKKAKPGTVLGHEVVGVIETLTAPPPGKEPLPFQVGDRIVAAHHVPCGTCHYCLNDSQSMCRHFKETNLEPGGFAQQIALSYGHLQHTTFKIPETVSDEAASCVEPLACVLRGLERLPEFHQGSVAIVGLGFIGLLAAQAFRHQGYQVYGLDLDAERRSLATRHAMAHHAFDPRTDTEAMAACLQRETPLGQVDVVFLSVVNAASLQEAFRQVRDGGTVVLFASPSGTPLPTLDPGPLYYREINIVSSYSPSLKSLQWAADLLFNGHIDTTPLMTHRVGLRDLAQGLDWYRTGKAIKVFVDMKGTGA